MKPADPAIIAALETVPMADATFSSTLSWPDRQRLRAVIKAVQIRHYPVEFITDFECDKIIDAWGPRIAESVVKQAVDLGAVP